MGDADNAKRDNAENCPVYLVLDDRVDLLSMVNSIMTALGVEHFSTDSKELAEEFISRSRSKRLVGIVDKNLGHGEESGLEIVVDWALRYTEAEWHSLSAFQYTEVEKKRLETHGIIWHDKGLFDLYDFVRQISESRPVITSPPPEITVSDLANLKEAAFESRSMAEFHKRESELHRRVWGYLAEPLVHQIEFDLSADSGVSEEFQKPRALIGGRLLSTDELAAEIRNQSRLGVELVESYMEVVNDIVLNVRGVRGGSCESPA